MAGPKYSLTWARTFCIRVAGGQSLDAICAQDDMPPKATVIEWLATKPSFRKLYATRGAQLVDCDARRRLALDTTAAEHALQDELQAERVKRTRPWWRFGARN